MFRLSEIPINRSITLVMKFHTGDEGLMNENVLELGTQRTLSGSCRRTNSNDNSLPRLEIAGNLGVQVLIHDYSWRDIVSIHVLPPGIHLSCCIPTKRLNGQSVNPRSVKPAIGSPSGGETDRLTSSSSPLECQTH